MINFSGAEPFTSFCLALFLWAIGLAVVYWVIRLAVRHALTDVGFRHQVRAGQQDQPRPPETP